MLYIQYSYISMIINILSCLRIIDQQTIREKSEKDMSFECSSCSSTRDVADNSIPVILLLDMFHGVYYDYNDQLLRSRNVTERDGYNERESNIVDTSYFHQGKRLESERVDEARITALPHVTVAPIHPWTSRELSMFISAYKDGSLDHKPLRIL